MLSGAVEADTREFYRSHKYFGLDENQIRFFVQGEFPCVDNDGKILLDEKGKMATAPNGNGGIFAAMKEQVHLSLFYLQSQSLDSSRIYF
jgi:UDP-N-acetylglucosamine/UDP-N-acetylgalactosamine diphosphorylase